MGCCSSSNANKRMGLESHKRQILSHFLPPGDNQAERYTYRLERVEERDMQRVLGEDRGASSSRGAEGLASEILNAIEGEKVLEDKPPPKEPQLVQAVSGLLKARLGTCDAPLVGQDRHMLVETPIGTVSNSFVTESVVVEEDSLVRLVEERAAQGLLFTSSCLSLATFEKVQTDCLVLLEPLALDTGVDFDALIDTIRERALEGWRFRGGLQGRCQVQDYVLQYAVYSGVVVTPFSHLVLARDKNAHRLQMEIVELRASGSVISGTLVRIVKAWARRGWKLSGVLYNVVTTYDRVAVDEPLSVQGGEVGGDGQLHVCFDVAAVFERRLGQSQEGRIQAHIALQNRARDLAQGEQSGVEELGGGGGAVHMKRVV